MTDDREVLFLQLYDRVAAEFDARLNGKRGFVVVHGGIRSTLDVVRFRSRATFEVRLAVLADVPDDDLQQMTLVLRSGIADTSLESLQVEDEQLPFSDVSHVRLRGLTSDVQLLLNMIRVAPTVLADLADFYPELGLHVARG